MKKHTHFYFLLLIICQLSFGQSPAFKTYMNPVIPGDHPDCTITKVGNDFYTTGSSFNPTPVIYHSTDLVHWEAISQPVSAAWSTYADAAGGGCWGGHLVYYNSKYWDFFSRSNTMYYVNADNPKGPWSTPVKINNPSQLSYGLGYDNSIFIDDNNKWYLVVKNGQANNGIVELNNSAQPTGTVFNLSWLNPSPSYPYSWAEGPVMWKYNGYYYYSFARDVGGGQKVMRSQTLTATQSAWEIFGDLFNENDPDKSTSLFSSPNHASSVIMLSDSSSWVMHPVYARDEWKAQGRQGLLNQVKYQNGRPIADYPVDKAFSAPKLSSSGIPWMVPKSDFFNSTILNPEWSFIGYTLANTWSLSDRSGWLRLTPKSSTKANTLVKNDGEHNYSLITKVDLIPLSKSDEAGLRIIRGDETTSIKLYSTMNAAGKKTIAFAFGSSVFEVENTIGTVVWLKMVRENHTLSGYYSSNGQNWTQLGSGIDISTIDAYSDYSTWAGSRQGLYVAGSQVAYFDSYIYRDAYTTILAECPANQYGTTSTITTDGGKCLSSIHNDDWALFAGVEFGNNDYSLKVDSVQFSASCTSVGGKIEVWLDSIDTGKKIADCVIDNTSSLSNFKIFKAKVDLVTGNHDVYIKFTGTYAGELFQLKSLQFINKSSTSLLSEIKDSICHLRVYPNPSNNQLNIRSDFDFKTIEICNLDGSTLYSETISNTVKSKTLQLQLPKGIYLIKVTGVKDSASSKIMIK